MQSLMILIAVGLIGGAIFLGVWDLPPPTQTVEKVIPNDRLPR